MIPNLIFPHTRISPTAPAAPATAPYKLTEYKHSDTTPCANESLHFQSENRPFIARIKAAAAAAASAFLVRVRKTLI